MMMPVANVRGGGKSLVETTLLRKCYHYVSSIEYLPDQINQVEKEKHFYIGICNFSLASGCGNVL